MTADMLMVGDDELRGKLRDVVKCPHCTRQHALEYGDEVHRDGTRTPSRMLAFYRCAGVLYLAGINGRALHPVEAL